MSIFQLHFPSDYQDRLTSDGMERGGGNSLYRPLWIPLEHPSQHFVSAQRSSGRGYQFLSVGWWGDSKNTGFFSGD